MLVCADGEVAGVQELALEAALAEVERDRLKMEFTAHAPTLGKSIVIKRSVQPASAPKLESKHCDCAPSRDRIGHIREETS